MIVRWGLEELPSARSGEQPFLVASERWRDLVEAPHVWTEVPSHRIEVPADADGDRRDRRRQRHRHGQGRLGSERAAARLRARRRTPAPSGPSSSACATRTGGCRAAAPARRLHGIVYEPKLTLELPRAETVGTALNALAHSAEALYVDRHNPEADAEALAGARLIGEWLPQVVERPTDLEARTELLRGACHAGAALGKSFLALGHAMAQALGGRFGLPHGAMNALCLPPALRFNAEAVPEAVARFGEALGAADPAARVEELARLGGFERLRDFGVPEQELGEVAAAVVERAGAKANPRPASARRGREPAPFDLVRDKLC